MVVGVTLEAPPSVTRVAMRTRLRKLTIAIAAGSLVASVNLATQSARASGTLPLTWSVTVGQGPGSSGPSPVSPQTYAGATVGDLFGDGRKEVMVGLPDGSVRALDGTSGSVLPGWPQYTGGPIHSNVTVADLFHDGRHEIISTSESGKVYVWNGDGSLVSGWPQRSLFANYNTRGGFFGAAAVGDLFHDGNQELVAASWDHHLYAWDAHGRTLSGFPIKLWDTGWETPSLADVEGRGQLDIVVGFDSTTPPGGYMWAFRPTGCPANTFPTQTNCQLPGWPVFVDQTPWASTAVADLAGNGTQQIVGGSGANFTGTNGRHMYAWNGQGQNMPGWPVPTGGPNFDSPAVGDLFANGQREIVEESKDGYLYAWGPGGVPLQGWPINLNLYYEGAYPTIAPISSTSNGVWILNNQSLQGYNGNGQLVWTGASTGYVGFAPPTVARISASSLSAITVAQANAGGTAWTINAYAIPGTSKMLAGSWPTQHGNSQGSGTIAPSATITPLPAVENVTQISVSWTLDAGSPPAVSYNLWAEDTAVGRWQRVGTTSSTTTAFNGTPGHTYRLAVQAVGPASEQEISYWDAYATAAFSPGATYSTPFKGLYAVDRFGDLHPGSSAPLSGNSTWPGWSIVRDIEVSAGRQGGYTLDAFGGVHEFGGAPSVTTTAYWSGWDIARALVLRGDGHSGYVLDGWGGLHPFGTSGDVPAVPQDFDLHHGWDIMRDVQLRPDGTSGYTLDGWGGVHEFGGAPVLSYSGYWYDWDIAHRFTLNSAGTGGFVMDGWGGLHQFGAAAATSYTGYWSGWDIARDVVLIPGSSTQGYVVDAFGGFHTFGGAPGVSSPTYWQGTDIPGMGIG